MDRYDRGWNRGYGRGHGLRGGWRGYGSDFGMWEDAWGTADTAGFRGRGVGLYRSWGTPWEARGEWNRYDRGFQDRGVYGSGYPGYGGYPRGGRHGMYYGGRGYAAEYGPAPRGRGYDESFAREPFVPEAAYRAHPEMNRPQRPVSDRWPARGHDLDDENRDWSDDEVRRSVRQNLYQDSWVDAGPIQVGRGRSAW